MFFREKHHPNPSIRLAEIGEEELPGATIPASIEEYLDWLRGYFRKGGQPTHFYNYPFEYAGFELAIGEALVNGRHEYGANLRRIIVGKHGELALKPGTGFEGWAHTTVYLLCDFSTPQNHVPIYSNPEFETILTDEHREQRAAVTAKNERLFRQAERRKRSSILR